MVTQRIANPCIPVRFRALPPKKNLVLVLKKSKLNFLHSSVAQLVEQLTVNQLVAGSSPARGAKKDFLNEILKLFAALKFYKVF
jgi:hypothetical protein